MTDFEPGAPPVGGADDAYDLPYTQLFSENGGIYIANRYAAVARTIGCALTGADEFSWDVAATVFCSQLLEAERASLAWAALKSLDPDQRDLVFEALGQEEAGFPISSEEDVMDAATMWAEGASETEARAYAIACYFRMEPAAQADFREYLGKVLP